MTKLVAVVLCLSFLIPLQAKAASQDACAIWLCLPGGFPSGCGGAHSEFKKRIKKGKSPLPDLSSCTVDGKTKGNYQLGIEPFVPCKAGYTLKTYGQSYGYYGGGQGSCYSDKCANRIGTAFQGDWRCENYEATRRSKPRFIKMWIDGQYQGQFFYQ